jgi:D-alanine-D-alanine ligase-like ATP-grasp enzyme
MREQIIISLEALRSLLKVEKGCFELYGYDFLVDSDLDAWLVEVNTNPSLDESSHFLKGLLARMVNDALRLTIDVVFG